MLPTSQKQLLPLSPTLQVKEAGTSETGELERPQGIEGATHWLQSAAKLYTTVWWAQLWLSGPFVCMFSPDRLGCSEGYFPQ